MAREIKIGDLEVTHRRVYFDIRELDGITPALGEEGGQPQISINGQGWADTGIGTLVEIGYGRYYADLSINVIQNVGDVIETRYAGPTTAETPGDTFIVISESTVEYSSVTDDVIIEAYATVDDADFYFQSRLGSDAWDSATYNDRLKALRTATRMIDRLNFEGEKYNSNQVLEFPRYPNNYIPVDIKIACFEIALSLLEGVDINNEIENLYTESRSYAATRISYNRSFIPDYIRAGIPSAVAWTYLRPYLIDPKIIRLHRIG